MTQAGSVPTPRASDEADASGRVWDRFNLAPPPDVVYWLGVPVVAEYVHRLTTGEVGLSYLHQFFRWASPPAARRVLSVGCGAGALERELVRHGVAVQVDGIDVSEASLAAAAASAVEHGFADRIAYHRSDARGWLERAGAYDLVMFNQVLHHIVDLEAVLELAAAALRGRSPGLVYVDEYIGPTRDAWTDETLGFAAGLFARVPPEARRTPQMWPPIAYEDPTEMIRSREIPAIFGSTFDLVEARPYYGNVLFPLVNAIRADAIDRPEVAALLREAVDLERHLVERRLIEPLFAVGVGRPKRS